MTPLNILRIRSDGVLACLSPHRRLTPIFGIIYGSMVKYDRMEAYKCAYHTAIVLLLELTADTAAQLAKLFKESDQFLGEVAFVALLGTISNIPGDPFQITCFRKN